MVYFYWACISLWRADQPPSLLSKQALMKLYPLTKATYRSKLVLWITWGIVVFIGLSYIGYKATQRQQIIKAAQSPAKEAPIGQPNAAQAMPSPTQILSYLQSLQVLAPVGSTVQIVLQPPTEHSIAPSDLTASGVAVSQVVTSVPVHEELWQKGQKQMLIVQGSSSAGVDLGLLKASDIDLPHMTIRLPPAQIFSTQVETIVAYDVATGQRSTMQFGLLRPDAQIRDAQQQMALQACSAGVLQAATDATAKQVITLLRLMRLNVIVQSLPPIPCESVATTSALGSPNEVVSQTHDSQSGLTPQN